MQKAVVTGGMGFIGTHLVEALKKDGCEVVVVDLKNGTNILNMDDLRAALSGAHTVFHLAALPRVQFSIEHPEESNETNVVGTLRVLQAAKEMGVRRVVYSASSSAYGDQEVMPLTEDMQPRPKSPYALQKYVGELYCRVYNEVYGLPTVSLRYFNVYGPGADSNGPYALVIAKFLAQQQRGEPITITGDGSQTRDFTHVRDVVRANILAATSQQVGKGEVINIGAGNGVSIKKIAELIGGPIEYIPARLEPQHTLADNTKARKLLGWEPQVTFAEGVAELQKLSGLV
jgi:UDP-glucose 4-epimerase